MKKLLIGFILILSFAAVAQKPSKNDCYKKFQTTDTTFVNLTWRDSLSYLHYDQGLLLVTGIGLTCLPKVYDTVYNEKIYILYLDRNRKVQTRQLDPRNIIQLQEVKNK